MRAPWASHYGIFSFFRHFPQRIDDCRGWPEPQRAFGFILRHQSSMSIRRDPVRLGARAGFIPYGSRVTPLLPASKHLSRRNFIAKARPPRVTPTPVPGAGVIPDAAGAHCLYRRIHQSRSRKAWTVGGAITAATMTTRNPPNTPMSNLQ